jgi:putative hydrolase of the HAD superfamily
VRYFGAMLLHESLRIVVFDAVGTLIYPDPPVSAVYVKSAKRLGSNLADHVVAARFRAVFGELESRDRAGDLRTSEEVELARWRTIVRGVLDDVSDPAASFAELYDHFARPTSWRVFPDVGSAFDLLASRGIQLAIASNFDQRLLGIAQQLAPLDRCIHVLVSSAIGYRKPHRRFFEAVLEASGFAPEEVLYVGDDHDNDVAGARAVGMRAVLLDRAGSSGPDALASLDQLAQKLRGPA